jgi:hypothetical protein
VADRNVVIEGLIELHLAGKGGAEAVASMKQILAQTKEVEKSTGGFAAGTAKATAEVGKLDAAMVGLGKTVAGYFAAGVVANFLRDSYIGFARTERQALALEHQIRALGDEAGAVGLRAFIKDLSQTYGILDDDLVPAMQRAVGAFKDVKVSQEIVGIAAKFAANGIGDVGTNLDAIARFFQSGSARGLVQFGVDIKGAADGTIDLNEGLRALTAQAGTLGSGFRDAQRDVDELRIAWDSLKDSVASGIGGMIAGLRAVKEQTDKNTIDGMRRNRENLSISQKEWLDAYDAREQAAVDAFFNAETTIEASSRAFAEKQSGRDKEAADKKAADLVKSERDRLEKVDALEQQSHDKLLGQRAARAEAGSQEQIDILLRLNASMEAAAIESARKIGAQTVEIEKFFAGERDKIRAGKGESKATKDAREAEDALDPRAGFDEVEKAYQEHQLTLTAILEEALIERLQLAIDLAPEGSQERLDAIAGLEEAEFALSTERKIAAAQGDAELIGAIKDAAAEHEKGRIKAVEKFGLDADRARLQSNLAATQQIAGALGGLFAKNKGFAIAMAVVNTALGITMALSDPSLPSWYARVAAAIVVAASGVAQIAAIRSASPGGGGGSISASGGGFTAAAPTQSAAPPPGSQIAPVSQAQAGALDSRGQPVAAGGTTINIQYAFGDRQAMTKLARELNRVNANDQGNIR